MMQPIEAHAGEARSGVSVSMVALLPLLLIPLVISGFFLVYALVGLVLEGDSLIRWRNEAWSVSWPTASIQLGVCVCIIAYARYKKLPWGHLLNWSSIAHGVLMLSLAMVVYTLTHLA